MDGGVAGAFSYRYGLELGPPKILPAQFPRSNILAGLLKGCLNRKMCPDRDGNMQASGVRPFVMQYLVWRPILQGMISGRSFRHFPWRLDWETIQPACNLFRNALCLEQAGDDYFSVACPNRVLGSCIPELLLGIPDDMEYLPGWRLWWWNGCWESKCRLVLHRMSSPLGDVVCIPVSCYPLPLVGRNLHTCCQHHSRCCDSSIRVCPCAMQASDMRHLRWRAGMCAAST